MHITRIKCSSNEGTTWFCVRHGFFARSNTRDGTSQSLYVENITITCQPEKKSGGQVHFTFQRRLLALQLFSDSHRGVNCLRISISLPTCQVSTGRQLFHQSSTSRAHRGGLIVRRIDSLTVSRCVYSLGCCVDIASYGVEVFLFSIFNPTGTTSKISSERYERVNLINVGVGLGLESLLGRRSTKEAVLT